MTPDDHYARAELWIEKARNLYKVDPSTASVDTANAAAIAQVHATLATIHTPPLGGTR